MFILRGRRGSVKSRMGVPWVWFNVWPGSPESSPRTAAFLRRFWRKSPRISFSPVAWPEENPAGRGEAARFVTRVQPFPAFYLIAGAKTVHHTPDQRGL